MIKRWNQSIFLGGHIKMNYSVGIDVSKGKNTVAIVDSSEKLQERVFDI